MDGNLVVRLCGVHSVAFALFHLAFWKLFDWPHSLQATTPANRAIIQILNLRLVYVLAGVAAACFAFPAELHATLPGRLFLGFMSVFWIGRTIEQFVFLRIDRWPVHVLTVLFALGAILFALPLASPG